MLRIFEFVVWLGLCLGGIAAAALVVFTTQGIAFAAPALLFLGFAVFAGWMAWRAIRPPLRPIDRPSPIPVPVPSLASPYTGTVVPLSQQLEEFRRIGLAPHAGLTEEVLLQSFPREEFEQPPYHTLLFMCCCEIEQGPEGRPASTWGWDFDFESIEGEGSYARILKEIERLTGRTRLITNVRETHDVTAGRVRLGYRLADKPYTLNLRLNNDWADAERLEPLLTQIEEEVGDGRRFWAGDNGQGILLLFIPDDTAHQLNALSPNLVERLVP